MVVLLVLVVFSVSVVADAVSTNVASWIPFTKVGVVPTKGADIVGEVCHGNCRARLAQSIPSVITTEVASQNFYLLNGGFNGEGGGYYFVFQDIWMVRQVGTTSVEWSILVHRNASWPQIRDGAQFRIMNNGDILLYGGYNYDQKYYLNGVFVFDTSTLQWITLQDDTSSNGPLPRAWGFMQSLRVLPNGDEDFFMFAGEGSLDRIAWNDFDQDLQDSWILTIGKTGPGGTYQFTWRNTNSDICDTSLTTCSDSKNVANAFPVLAHEGDQFCSRLVEAVRPNIWGDHLVNLTQDVMALAANFENVMAGPNTTNTVADPTACSTICLKGKIPSNFPSGRDATRFRVYGNKVFLFGGYACIQAGSYKDGGERCFPSTIHIYDFVQNVWSNVSKPLVVDETTATQSRLWPLGRSYHNVELYQNKLWITGGAYINTVSVYTFFNDMHVFNLDTLLWEDVTVRGPLPSLRWDATSIMDNGKMWYFQGNVPGTFFGDDWMLAIGLTITSQNFTAFGPALSGVVAGVPQQVFLQTVNTNGVALTWGVGLVQFFDISFVANVLPNPANGFISSRLSLFAGTITEGVNGGYIASFIPLNGPVSLFVKFDGEDIPGSPFLINVNNTAVAARQSFSLVKPVAVEQVTAFVDVQLQDDYGNAAIDESVGDYFTLSINAATQSNGLITSVAYLGAGQYRLFYNAPDAASFQLYVQFNGTDIFGSPFDVESISQLGVPQRVRAGMMVLAGLGILITVTLMILVAVHRDNPVMRAATPIFMEIMLFGSVLGVFSIFAYATESDAACRAFPFVLGLGYVILMGALYIKTWRLMIIFRMNQMKLVRITLWYMSWIMLCVVTLEFGFNIAWQSTSPPMLQTIQGTPYPRTYTECTGDSFNTWQGVSYLYKAVVLLYGIFLSIMTRGLPTAFNESAWIGLSIYNVALTGGVVLLIVYAGNTQDTLTAKFVLICVGIIWVSVGTALCITVPKLYRIYDEGDHSSEKKDSAPLSIPQMTKSNVDEHVPAQQDSKSEPIGLMMVDRFHADVEKAIPATPAPTKASNTSETRINPTDAPVLVVSS